MNPSMAPGQSTPPIMAAAVAESSVVATFAVQIALPGFDLDLINFKNILNYF